MDVSYGAVILKHFIYKIYSFIYDNILYDKKLLDQLTFSSFIASSREIYINYLYSINKLIHH